jgi:TonB family protein
MKTHLITLILTIFFITGCADKCPDCANENTIELLKSIVYDNITGSKTDGIEKTFSLNVDLIELKQHDKDPEKYHCSANITLSPLIDIKSICDKLKNNDKETIVSFKRFLSTDTEANSIYEKIELEYQEKVRSIRKEAGESIMDGLFYNSQSSLLKGFFLSASADENIKRIPTPIRLIAESYNNIPTTFSVRYYSTLSKQVDGQNHLLVGVNGMDKLDPYTTLLMKFLCYYSNNKQIADTDTDISDNDNHQARQDSIDIANTPDREATIISIPTLHYPEKARIDGKEGKVFVSVNIDKHGNPLNTIVVKREPEDYFDFDEEALRIAKEAKYTPEYKNGTSIESKMILPVRFSLRDN